MVNEFYYVTHMPLNIVKTITLSIILNQTVPAI